MKIRLYIKQKISLKEKIELESEKAHYLKNVLRAKTGQKIYIFNEDDGEFEALLICEKFVFVNPVMFVKPAEILKKKIHLAFANIKNNLVADVLNSCTQTGIYSFFPMITEFTINKNFSHERGLKIIEEASEQCERITMPKLDKILQLSEILANIKNKGLILFCDEKANFEKNKLIEVAKDFENIFIFIGPEGGFSEKERILLKSEGAETISLSPFILRAETASLCASFFAYTFL
jgi:16S rRNA (uracil1498-N3)-methyltransferase